MIHLFTQIRGKVIINSINRILKIRLADFRGKARHYGLGLALWDLLWWVCFYTHLPFSWKLSTLAIRRKTAWLDRYVERKYSDIIGIYTSAHAEPNEAGERRIWVFWGQGEDSMPELIRACYEQLVALNGDAVTLVTNQNVHEFLDIPAVIYEKVERGAISWAHFSDIIRTSLLARYGGLWLDATVWTTRQFPFEKFSDLLFYSANGKVAVNSRAVRFWTSFQWNWSTWCMLASRKQLTLFRFVSEMMKAVAIREEFWTDYVFQDYLIYYACRKLPGVGDAMSECNKTECRLRNRLAEFMNRPYNEQEYEQLTATDYVFKLSFRAGWQPATADGATTYYGKLIAHRH